MGYGRESVLLILMPHSSCDLILLTERCTELYRIGLWADRRVLLTTSPTQDQPASPEEGGRIETGHRLGTVATRAATASRPSSNPGIAIAFNTWSARSPSL